MKKLLIVSAILFFAGCNPPTASTEDSHEEQPEVQYEKATVDRTVIYKPGQP